MALNVHEVAEKLVVRGPEKMIESDVVERCSGGEARDVATQFGSLFIGAHYHRHCIPADQSTDFSLDAGVARHALFQLWNNGIQIRGVGAERDVGAVAARLVDQLFEQIMRTRAALDFEN